MIGSMSEREHVADVPVSPPMLVVAVPAMAAASTPARHEAIVLSSRRAAVHKVHAGEDSTLTFTVRGRSCTGAPRLVATVDGKRVISRSVKGRKAVSLSSGIAAGAHTVRLRLANPHRSAHCRRSLRIKSIKLTAGRPAGAPGASPQGGSHPASGAPGGAPLQSGAAGSRWAPARRTTWQWQLSGTLDQTVPADMYDVDLFDTPASTVASLHGQSRRVTCYIDAGSYEPGRPDSGDFPASVQGAGVDGWPGEKWLDIRRVDALAPIMRKRLDLCKSKGFDAVEADNVDGYSNSTGFPLSADDQLNYNRFLASEAHARGLAIGLKNDFDQVAQLQPDFEFAISEQCYEYDECNALKPFTAAGKPVFDVEYSGDPSSYCAQANSAGLMAMAKRMSLDAWRQPCW
jgi:hypothetical protein